MRRWEPAAAVRLLDEARKITMDLNIKHLLGVEPGTAWSESLRLEFNAINDGFTSIPFPFTFLLPFTKYAQALKVLLLFPYSHDYICIIIWFLLVMFIC